MRYHFETLLLHERAKANREIWALRLKSTTFEERYAWESMFTLKNVSPLLKSQRDAPQAFDRSVTERTDLPD